MIIIRFFLLISSITKLSTEIWRRVIGLKVTAYVFYVSHLCSEMTSLILAISECSGVSNSFGEFRLKQGLDLDL